MVERLGAADDLSPIGSQIIKQVATYYDNDGESSAIDLSVMLLSIQAKSPLQYEKMEAILGGLPDAATINLIDALVHQRLQRIGSELTQAIAANDQPQIDTLIAERTEVRDMGLSAEGKEDPLFDVHRGTAVSDLTHGLQEGKGFKLLPGLLDKIVFNLLPGDHIALFAMVNRGKSACAIQIACDFAYDDKVVLYIGNEDPAERMILRIVGNLVGATLQEVMEDEELYTEKAKEEGYDNIIFKELAPGSTADVRRLIEHFKPDVVICDQARNLIPSGKSDGQTGKLEVIFNELRMMYKKHRVIGVSLTQAGDKDSKGKPLDTKVKLDQSDIADSKYGVAATIDVMIGIGATIPMVTAGQLYLNVCKNKASGIHDGVQAYIDPFTSSVKQ